MYQKQGRRWGRYIGMYVQLDCCACKFQEWRTKVPNIWSCTPLKYVAICVLRKQFRPRLDTTELLIYIKVETTSGCETTRGKRLGAKRLGGNCLEVKRPGFVVGSFYSCCRLLTVVICCWRLFDKRKGSKTVHRQDNSPTRFWRQFADRIEDSSPTLLMTVHRHICIMLIDIWLKNIIDCYKGLLLSYDLIQ